MIHVYKPDLVFWTEHGYSVGSEQEQRLSPDITVLKEMTMI